MRKTVVFIFLMAASGLAFAGYASLVSCNYEYNLDLNKSVYVGTYQALSGNYYRFMFDHYCPQSLNL